MQRPHLLLSNPCNGVIEASSAVPGAPASFGPPLGHATAEGAAARWLARQVNQLLMELVYAEVLNRN